MMNADLAYALVDFKTLLVFFIALISIWAYRSTLLPVGFPPGPRRFPFIGNLFMMATNQLWIHKKLYELSKIHGPVFGYSLLGRPGVVLNGLDVIKEALVNKSRAFSNRPSTFVIDSLWSKKGAIRGVIWQNGISHKLLRRFSLQSLREFGVGKHSTEARIQEEAKELCNAIYSYSGTACDVTSLVQAAVSNIICSICFGNRFEYEDPSFINLQQKINYNLAKLSVATPLNFIPWLRYSPTESWFWKLKENWKEIDDFFLNQIELHRQTFDPTHLRDFVDLYITKEKENHDEKETFSTHNMQRLITDLFVAGTDTTSTGIRWMLLYMLHFPEVQMRCQQEVEKVVGLNQPPALSDRAEMPYVNATIHEVHRIANITPLAVPYIVTEDTTIRGYKIPKESLVLVNLFSCHMDPKYWDNPEEFIPERWVGSDGAFKKHEAYVPFSIGPRSCLGETLAKNEIFIFFTTLLQRFTFSSENSILPDLVGKLGVTLSPPEFKIICETR